LSELKKTTSEDLYFILLIVDSWLKAAKFIHTIKAQRYSSYNSGSNDSNAFGCMFPKAFKKLGLAGPGLSG